jgi:thioredoxin reductase/NAD-dependent dihydropyrimidine dehydrogenase PreA subunit
LIDEELWYYSHRKINFGISKRSNRRQSKIKIPEFILRSLYNNTLAMNTAFYFIIVYLFPLTGILVFYIAARQRREKKIKIFQKEQIDAGLTEPASLHPIIDPFRCTGCNACVSACPEKNVLGIIDGKAVLVSPSNCIGHGLCRVSCPFDAITLVFGTEKRGVDIPFVQPNFETNVPGIFIAGELGGMGLIRNAIEQGRQAMAAIGPKVKTNMKGPDVRDVVIIGAGPAGFSAALCAIEQKLDYLVLEQEVLGGTVSHYPRGKVVMTRPVVLPLIGKVHLRETTKESLLAFWSDVEKKSGVKINYNERVEKVVQENGYFIVKTQKQSHKTQTILLAIGRRGTSRKLGVPGEEKDKVVYRLVDPAQYRSLHVLVVGGGDAALEAALSIAQEGATTVTLSYRGDSFSRAKPKNRDGIHLAQEQKRLNVLFNSNVLAIRDGAVTLETLGKTMEMENDAVLICAGGVLPTDFLKDIGIAVETKYGKI